MHIRHTAAIPVALALTALAAACGGDASTELSELTESSTDPVTIGMFEITSGAVFDDISAGFVEGFLEGTGLAREDITLVEENAQGDPSLIQSIARAFADGDADMVAVVGTPAVIAQAELITDRPIIAMAMGDPVGAGVATSLDAPGGNVTGSIDYIDPALLVDDLVAVHPDLDRLGTLFDPANQNMQVWIDDLRATIADRGLELVEASATTSSEVEAAARSLGDRVDAVLTGPDAMVIEAMPAVGQVMRRAGLPLYTVGGDIEIDGVVAALGPDYREVGRLAGLAAADVHNGADAGDVAFRRPGGLEWTLDEVEAERLDLAVPRDLFAAAN